MHRVCQGEFSGPAPVRKREKQDWVGEVALEDSADHTGALEWGLPSDSSQMRKEDLASYPCQWQGVYRG